MFLNILLTNLLYSHFSTFLNSNINKVPELILWTINLYGPNLFSSYVDKIKITVAT